MAEPDRLAFRYMNGVEGAAAQFPYSHCARTSVHAQHLTY